MNDTILFKNVHRRLTILCAAITVAILCLFSCLYLYLAEKMLRDNYRAAFRQDMLNLASSLEQQTVITYAYLNGLEQNSGYQIYLWDQGNPFLYNSIQGHTLTTEEQTLLLSYLPAEGPPFEVTSGTVSVANSSPTQCTLLSVGEDWVMLKHQSTQNQEYQVFLTRLSIGQPSAAQQLIDQQTPGLTMLVAAFSQKIQKQILRQRLYFLMVDLTGILFLTLFAGFFTKKLLHPLLESHQRQIRFVADASHELRTPLAVIRACLSAKPPAYEQTIDQECARMGHLIEDLLTLSRLDHGAIQLDLQDVDLDTLLLTVYEQMELLAIQKQIRLQLQLPANPLPHVRGDLRKLEQLITILLQNALNYTPTGGNVILSAQFTQTVEIRVVDNGSGIPDADKSHIFERFYRVEHSHTDRSHFGLGLCIAQEIALTHGGVLTVTDTEGGGATFCFTLPYDRKSRRT